MQWGKQLMNKQIDHCGISRWSCHPKMDGGRVYCSNRGLGRHLWEVTFDLSAGRTLASVTRPFHRSHQFQFQPYTNFSCFLLVWEDQGLLYDFLWNGMNTDEKQKEFPLHTWGIMGNRTITISQPKAAMGCLNDPLLSVIFISHKGLCTFSIPGGGHQSVESVPREVLRTGSACWAWLTTVFSQGNFEPMSMPKSAWKAVFWTHHVPGIIPSLWWPLVPLTYPFLCLGYSCIQCLFPLLAVSHCDFWSRCPWLIRVIEASLFQTWATSHCQHRAGLGAAYCKLSVPLLLSKLWVRIPTLLSTVCNMWFLEM